MKNYDDGVGLSKDILSLCVEEIFPLPSGNLDKATGIYAYFSGMKAASVNEIKEQLKESSKAELIGLCLRLARFKKENKELLDYLLFQAHDLEGYITLVKAEMDELFGDVNTKGVYLAKKTLRKILRIANKHIRYTGDKIAEAEILLHYVSRFRDTGLPWREAKILRNIHDAQVKKISAAIAGMHEDLQYDYLRSLRALQD